MMRKLVPGLVWFALLLAPPQPSFAREAGLNTADTVWTAIIPDGFPGFIYTWHMRRDGSYREDGRDARSGTPIQPTLSGHWSRDGAHMLLTQSDQPYVFDGVVLGGRYSGTLYFHGRAYSRFCAAESDEAPIRCDTTPGIAALTLP
jgi:hypothetical protein